MLGHHPETRSLGADQTRFCSIAFPRDDDLTIFCIHLLYLLCSSCNMQRIQTEEDVVAWKQSPGYRAFFTWIERRAERIVGKEIVEGNAAEEGCSEVCLVIPSC